MTSQPSSEAHSLRERLLAFMDAHIYPNEARYEAERQATGWNVIPLIEELKPKARAEGLWNLFLPERRDRRRADQRRVRAALRNHGPRAVVRRKSSTARAPDTGNMEVLARYGSPEQQRRGCEPLLAGKIRSCFAMTEPGRRLV